MSYKKINFVVMDLVSYVSDLLYRYDCVIVPDFGGFVTNKISAKIGDDSLYPPTKLISFNAQLTHNDGLLVNHIASCENITFNNAIEKIAVAVSEWRTALNTQSIALKHLGSLSYTEEMQLVFEPSRTTNFLPESFGLSAVEVSAIEKYKQEVKPLLPEVSNIEEEVVENKKSPVFIRYAAAAAVLVAGYIGITNYSNSNVQELVEQQGKVEKQIQEATFIIDNQLPSINLNIAKKNKNIHIIAGAFQLAKNADKKIVELKNKGYDARILGKNEWGLTQVVVESYSSKEEALNAISNVRENASKDAWILVKN